LEEAYRDPINRSDIGLLQRNLVLSRTVDLVLRAWFPRFGRYLDWGGGYGVFVRLMRDLGHDFRMYDPYTTCLFARGFDMKTPEGRFALVTAFEVFEHWADPMANLAEIFRHTDHLLFTTELVPTPVPAPEAWWYFGLDHGQHVGFIARRTLDAIAGKFGMHACSNGRGLHLLSRKPVAPPVFDLLTRPWVYVLASLLLPRHSLQARDYEAATRGGGGA